MNYASIIIPFMEGGLGMFIYGMQIMAQGLENAALQDEVSIGSADENKLWSDARRIYYGSDPEFVGNDSYGRRVCKRRYHESVSGDGRHHGSKYRNDGNGRLVSRWNGRF